MYEQGIQNFESLIFLSLSLLRMSHAFWQNDFGRAIVYELLHTTTTRQSCIYEQEQGIPSWGGYYATRTRVKVKLYLP
jgi:hypothetical protein